MMRRALLAVMLVLLSASCQSSREPSPTTAYPVHVVVCWLKSPGDEAGRQKLIDVSRSFDGIPGVVTVAAGRAIGSDRPVVDDSFDVAIVMAFRDEAALRAYNDHPAHKKAVEKTLKPLVGKMVIYDFIDR